MQHAISLLNAGIHNVVRSIDRIERMNNSARDRNENTVRLLDETELESRIGLLNATSKEFECAKKVLNRYEMHRKDRKSIRTFAFYLCGIGITGILLSINTNNTFYAGLWGMWLGIGLNALLIPPK